MLGMVFVQLISSWVSLIMDLIIVVIACWTHQSYDERGGGHNENEGSLAHHNVENLAKP